VSTENRRKKAAGRVGDLEKTPKKILPTEPYKLNRLLFKEPTQDLMLDRILRNNQSSYGPSFWEGKV